MLKWIFRSLLALLALAALIAVGGYFALKRPDIGYDALSDKYGGAASLYADLPNGVRMHYRDEGNSNGPPLLLIHGFSASLHTWTPWVERLGGEYRIVSLDLPGHGLTSAPANYQATIESLRDAVAAFAQAKGLARFALAGSSMGGNIAWEYALAHPEQVDALILVDASGWEETRADLSADPPIFKVLRNPVLGPLMRDLDNSALARQGLVNSFADADAGR